MTLLIPAYEPDYKLILLIGEIQKEKTMDILIVDDGSGAEYAPVFRQAEEMGCTVLRHQRNLGKGAALKTGFRYLMEKGASEGVICANGNGQHSAEDICMVASEIQYSQDYVVIGSRQMTPEVTLPDRCGITLTKWIFRLTAGGGIQDALSGLRGYPARLLPWLCTIGGSRYEYEWNVLLELKPTGYALREKPIRSSAAMGNDRSHFRPIVDSALFILPFIKFSILSLASGVLDFILLLVLQSLFGWLLASVVIARTTSSIVNYFCNKYLVFDSGNQKSIQSAPRYFLLAAIILCMNYLLLHTILLSGMPLVFAKLLTEAILFVFSYIVQKKLVFAKSRENLPADTGSGPADAKETGTI